MEQKFKKWAGKTRPKIGLALGAGGARGMAHLGVLQVLEEHDIPIDVITGSSIGSVVGGIYACGSNVNLLCKMAPLLNERQYFDIVIPRKGGILRGEKFKELIRVLTKNYDFSQTKIPFSCVAVDIEKGELVELSQGCLADAIRASISIPGVFELQRWDGRLLIDGGVLSRLPVQTARTMGADIVIGVDVGYRGDCEQRHVHKLFEVLYAATEIMSWEIARQGESDVDVLIVPKARHIDPRSLHQCEECIQLGRQAAIEAIGDIQKFLEVEEEELEPSQIA